MTEQAILNIKLFWCTEAYPYFDLRSPYGFWQIYTIVPLSCLCCFKKVEEKMEKGASYKRIFCLHSNVLLSYNETNEKLVNTKIDDLQGCFLKNLLCAMGCIQILVRKFRLPLGFLI